MKNKITLTFIFSLLLVSNSIFSQWTCGDTLVDTRDGKKYTTVLIGSQCWMKQNLNYGATVQSDSTSSFHSDMHDDGNAEKYAPGGDSTLIPQYGALYEWNELMDYDTPPGGRGLCPLGWHVPTNQEFSDMIAAAGGNITNGTGGNALKQLGEGFGAGAGTDASGFSAKAAGDRDSYGIFYGVGLRFIYWTSTQVSIGAAHHYTLWAENDTIEHLITQKLTGLACRCVKDDITSVPTHGFNQQNIDVYPNPTKDEMVIYNNTFNSKEQYIIRITNNMGQKVIEQEMDQERAVLNLSALPKGVFFVSVINTKSGEQELRRIVIQ